MTEEVNFDFSRVWIHVHNSSHIVTSGVVAPKDDDFLLSRVLKYLRVERQRFSRRLSRVWAQDSIEFIFIAILAVPIVVVEDRHFSQRTCVLVGCIGLAFLPRISVHVGSPLMNCSSAVGVLLRLGSASTRSG